MPVSGGCAGFRCSHYKSGIAQLKKSFLIDGSWFIVGFDSIERSATVTSDLGLAAVETAEDEHGHTWLLARMPAEATKATWGSLDFFGAIQRPTR